jgi:hypothetical protein
MKTIKHILYILIFVLGFTNCIPSENFLDNKLEDEVMVIIDQNGGYLNIVDEYYIFDADWDSRYIDLPEDDDLVGYELNIDGKIYPHGAYLRFSSNESKWYLDYEEERKYFNYPSDRTIIFKAIWKND